MMQLDIELKELKRLTLEMCDNVLENIRLSLNNLITQNSDCEIDDDKPDAYEKLIEAKCLDILTKERIYASDLKEVSGILKMVSDLERIADHAVDIMTFNKKLVKYRYKLSEDDIKMVDVSLKMTSDAITSFINKDVKLAQQTIVADDIVDDMYKSIIKRIISEKNQDESYLAFAIYESLVVKYIERISDHAVNIAEWVIYMATGYYKDHQIY